MSESSQFANEMLYYHNLARIKYGNVPMLSLDATLNSIAQNYANQLAYYDAGLTHNENRQNTGENLYSMTNMKPTAKRVVDSWVNYEVGKYDFNRGDFNSQTGHFTQVVWKNTQKLGVGVARTDDTWYVVCNYWPAGNVIGKFKENVFPPANVNNNSNKVIKYHRIRPINNHQQQKPVNNYKRETKPIVKDHKKMYTYHTGESLLSLFERYLSHNNNRWRDLLEPTYNPLNFNSNYNPYQY